MSNFVGSSLKNITSLTAGSLSGLYFTFEVNGFDVGDFGVVRFDLKERYNELFELNLLVVTESGRQLDFYSLLDRRGIFKVWEGGALQRSVSGIISVIRQRLWGMHTENYEWANPAKMDSLEKTGEVFDIWAYLMEQNRVAKNENRLPLYPLCEFLRVTTQVSNFD